MRATVVASMAVCVALSACAEKAVPPFASAPFSVARKGNTISVPFSVPTNVEIRRSYMLAFKYIRPETGDPLQSFWSRTPTSRLYLKVRLFRIDARGHEEPVPVDDHAQEYDPSRKMYCYPVSMEERGTDIANVSMSSTDGRVAHMEVVRFMPPDYGRYRFEVETLDDAEVFAPIASWLTVEREYRHFK
ncbi:hypothetical protein ABIE56_002070 [Luteibacter sp. 621]|uniref:hypothetical protein n=1 Tax=Luteibacter sp. 621 TaxID=3373916 RepID=UPI003D1981C4